MLIRRCQPFRAFLPQVNALQAYMDQIAWAVILFQICWFSEKEQENMREAMQWLVERGEEGEGEQHPRRMEPALRMGGALWWYARWRRTQPGAVSREPAHRAPDRREPVRRRP